MSINEGINTAFKHHFNNLPDGNVTTALAKQHRNRPQNKGMDTFKLYTHNKSLLPFMFLIDKNERTITNTTFDISKWRIVKECITDPLGVLSNDDYFDVLAELNSASLSLDDYLSKKGVSDKGIYITGCHKNPTVTYPGTAFPFTIGHGYWYSIFEFGDGTVVVSEVFYVPEDMDNYFGSGRILSRLDWRNSKDVFDILYQEDTFYNRIWVEEALIENKPSIVEEAIQTGKGNSIPVSIKYYDNYSLSDYIPEYLYRALLLMQGVDTIIFWERGYLTYGFLRCKNVDINWLDSGIDGVVEIEFEQENKRLSSIGCPENNTLGTPLPIQANDDLIVVYPKVGVLPGFSLLDNDIGISLSVFQQVNQSAGGHLTFDIKPNGTIDIKTAAGTIPSMSYTFNYTIKDLYNNTDTAVLAMTILDWMPTEDNYTLDYAAILAGQNTWNSGTQSVFDNDSYPINVDDVVIQNLVVPSQTSGSNNYLQFTADGKFTYYINTIYTSESFLVLYYNNITNSYKSQYVNFQLI